MGKVVSLPGGQASGGDGGGPDDVVLSFRVGRLEEDMGEIKATLKSMDARLGSIEQAIARMDGRLTGLEGRVAGLDAKISSLPSTWTILGIVFTTWALGSGILIFAMRVLAP